MRQQLFEVGKTWASPRRHPPRGVVGANGFYFTIFICYFWNGYL